MQYKNTKTGEVVTAHQWFKNGDHPGDYAQPVRELEHGHHIVYSPEYQRRHDWEGQVIRRYRHPEIDGMETCCQCGHVMQEHGMLDKPTLLVIHPGDMVVHTADGVHTIQSAYFLSNSSPMEVDV